MKKFLFPLTAVASLLLAVAYFTTGCVSTTPDFRQTIRVAEEKVFPTLVYIRVVCKELSDGKNQKAVVSGSGVVITPDGELLTNHHVIEKATEIRCLLTNGESYPAKLLGADKDLDIALLKLERPEGAKPLPFAKLSDRGREIGDVVLAMGAPWGLARSVTMGIISCKDRYLEGDGQYTLWYQTDATISPGNSGGPLVDTDGTVVGINARGMRYSNQAFTIPSTIILDLLPNLRKHGNAHWAWTGLQIQPLHDFDKNIFFDATNGVMVAGTDPGSPARKAGFKPNDRIVSINGESVTATNHEDLPALERKLGRMPFDQDITCKVVRGDKTLDIVFAPHEKGTVEGADKAFDRWGFTVKEINRFDTPDLAFVAEDGGVFVSAIAWDGNAETSGLKTRDIIKTIDDQPVHTVADVDAIYTAAMKKLDEKTKMRMTVIRNRREIQIVLNYLEDTEKENP